MTEYVITTLVGTGDKGFAGPIKLLPADNSAATKRFAAALKGSTRSSVE